MISVTLGAFPGGTTRGGHQGVESEARSLITPSLKRSAVLRLLAGIGLRLLPDAIDDYVD